MQRFSLYRFISAFFIILLLAACGNDESAKNSADEVPGDVIARVGELDISYSYLSDMLDSPAMMGASAPAKGTPERKQLILKLLDKVISSNLIYLDAGKQGTDKLDAYKENVNQFENALLASLYKAKVMIGNVPVSEVDVLHYYNTETDKEAELTDDLKLEIENDIRNKKLAELEATLRTRLRKNIDVSINKAVLSTEYDHKRSDENIVASYDGSQLSWGQIKGVMMDAQLSTSKAAIYINNDEERLKRLEQFIDDAIMTRKAREFGLEKDPIYIKRLADYQKARLIYEHRKVLLYAWNPSVDELKTYYNDNMNEIFAAEISGATDAADYKNFENPQTQVRVLRAYMQDKFRNYITELGNNHFKVAVYLDVLDQHFQQAADDAANSVQQPVDDAQVQEQGTEKSHQWMVEPVTE